MFFTTMLFTVCVLSLPLAAADPFLGAWKLNVAQSKSSSGKAFPAGTITIEAIPDGYRIASSGVTTPFILHLNGQDYKDDSKGFAATTGADTSSARRINGRTLETTFKRSGKVVGTIRREVSADDRLLTTMDGVNTKGEQIHSVVVSDRQ
jgi:hypothetical protein